MDKETYLKVYDPKARIEFPELPVHNVNGMRFYETPEGHKYPSITTVLGRNPDKQKGLQAWRKRVGEQQAGIISGKAARRGSAFHNICEDYLNGMEDIAHHKEKNFLAWCMFGEMRPYLDKSIGEIVLQEQNMYSDKYQVAGRCDFIGVYEDTFAVVDFKTTTTPKKEEWIEDYFIQCAAYASMYEEHTKISIEKLVIMMVAEDGQIQIFEKKTADYLNKLDTVMEYFYSNLTVEELAT
jgi:genome maintenance exonuclease 1